MLNNLWREYRRLWASRLARYALAATPKEDTRTVRAFRALFNEMSR